MSILCDYAIPALLLFRCPLSHLVTFQIRPSNLDQTNTKSSELGFVLLPPQPKLRFFSTAFLSIASDAES